MILRNFCLIIIEKTDGIKEDIIKVAEGNPRLLNTKSFGIATFSSAFKVNELKEIFTSNGRSVIIFELVDGGYSALLNDPTKHDFVFGHIEEFGGEIVNDITNKLLKEYLLEPKHIVSGSTKNVIKEEKNKKEEVEEDIDVSKLSAEEKTLLSDKLLDKISDNGYENFSDKDKELLKKLKE